MMVGLENVRRVLLVQPISTSIRRASSKITRISPFCAPRPFPLNSTLQQATRMSSTLVPPLRTWWRATPTQRQHNGILCMAKKQEKELPETTTSAPDPPVDILHGWQQVALYLFGLGFLLGPPLDGIHSRVQLQIYDLGAIDVGGLHTNIWVFPMLGAFYSVVGLLQLVLDKFLAPKGRLPTANLQKVVYSFLALAGLLEVSAELYKAGFPFNIEAYTLFFLAEINWLVFENTWWGFGLASLVGIVCPLAEIPINKLYGLWHYPRGNIELFGESSVTWLLACYFFYTPFISNLARYLSSVMRNASSQKRVD